MIDDVKMCTRCLENKPLDEFGLNRSTRTGRQSWCKPCTRARFAERYAEDPDLFRQRQRDFYAAKRQQDPDYYKRQGREWREQNRERALEYDRERNRTPERRQWHEQNRERRAEYQRAWRQRRKAEQKEAEQ